MPTMLLTGFLPFGESKSNPSQRIAERLHGEVIAGTQVVGLILPVALGVDFERVTEAIESYQPILVLSLGLAAGTTCLDIERFAVSGSRGPGSTAAAEPAAVGHLCRWPGRVVCND